MILVLIIGISLTYAQMPYDNDLGKELYHYSQAVFCSDEMIVNWNCGNPCDATQGMIEQRVIHSDLLQIRSFVGYQSNSDKIIVAFRGTVSKSQWMLDFFSVFHKHFCQECQVHEGFLTAWLSVRHDVLDQIRLLQKVHPTAELFITGHSLGAAIASLAAVEAQTIGLNVTALYTFGCPRVGNLAFSQYLNEILSTVYRVVHHNDLFPQAPPQYTKFHHYGTEVWFNADSTEYTICSQGQGEDPNCQDSVKKHQLSREDHSFYYDTYICECAC